MTYYTKRTFEVLAVANDGRTYRIERRCQLLPGDEDASHYYCCLPDGQLVTWLGKGRYELPNGTVVQIAGCLITKGK